MALVAVLVVARSIAGDHYGVAFERDALVRMRDDVTLRADIYRPDAPGTFPVLLQRTPYNKGEAADFGLKAAARGYVVVIQDVRGRYASEGEWYPFRHERDDGYDTIEWAASLPYADGKVGMFGGSYVGATQMLAAIAHPPHLAAICPEITASNYHENWTYQGGAFNRWFGESWTSQLAQDTYRRLVAERAIPKESTASLPLRDFWLFGTDELPTGSALTAKLAPYYLDWLAHPSYDDYWKRLSVEAHYPEITVPALHFAAWYDIFLDGSLRNFTGIKSQGGSDGARRGQRLLIYVGGHAGGPELRKIGAIDFGAQAPFDMDELMLRWFDAVLGGVANGVTDEKPVRLFVMGRNVWRDEEDWPLARALKTRYYLRSDGHSSAPARGILSRSPPVAEQPDKYLYDPQDPAPTIGGALCCVPLATGIGPQDQRPAEVRRDVLVYTTPVFRREVEVTGPIALDLYVSSSAVDTDFTGTLIDVWPNGFAQNLTSGILRMRYRDSAEQPLLAEPGKIYHITLNLGATSNVFLAGHRMQLQVSSSNFPRFDRNLNTGDDQGQAKRMICATNAIYHDRNHPSAMVVPLVP